MNHKRCLLGATVALSVSVSSAVLAGPSVTVTFKNNSDMDAEYDAVGSSAVSYAAASPKPGVTVPPGRTDIYVVTGALSPDVTSVIFQYKIGRKVCKFKTSYLKLPGRGAAPRWVKGEEASGGARCDAKITSTNASTHAWSVEFSMR